jgi:hypothetical protein
MICLEGDRAGLQVEVRTAGWMTRSLRASADACLPPWALLAPPERRGLEWAIDRAHESTPLPPARRVQSCASAPVRALFLLLLLCRRNE